MYHGVFNSEGAKLRDLRSSDDEHTKQYNHVEAAAQKTFLRLQRANTAEMYRVFP